MITLKKTTGKNQLLMLAFAIYIFATFKNGYGQYFCTANRLLLRY